MTKTVLVTGCAGYIGSVLNAYLLQRGWKVIGVDSLLYTNASALAGVLGHADFEFHRMDVRDTAGLSRLVERSDAVVHLAAIVGAPACDKDPQGTREVNRDATERLAELVGPDRRFIYPNTNSGYGKSGPGEFLTEEAPMNPLSLYALTKCDGERAVLKLPRALVFRLATVFGASPRMRYDLMVNDFTVRLVDSDILCRNHCLFAPLRVYEPQARRNFVHVRDVCRAIVLGLADASLAGAYNLGLPSANLTKMQLAETVCQTLGISTALAVVGKGDDPDRRDYLIGNDRILAAGFRFVYTLTEGIAEVAALYRLGGREVMLEKNA